MIRAKRYVSVAAGHYPAPKPAHGPAAASAVAELEMPVAEEPIAEEITYSDDFPIPGDQAAPSEAGDAEFAPPELASDELDDKQHEPKRSRTGILIGGVLGAVLGFVAGLLLMAFSHSAPKLSLLTDPMSLWLSTGDPLVRIAAVLIAAGFLLLGVGLGAWSRRSQR